MGWWTQFDRAEVAVDFARIAGSGLDSVRVFLTWEDFQPAPDAVDQAMLERLVTVADLAGELGLSLVPTLFTGHMSGVNWIPAWALGGSEGDDRFRVVSGGTVVEPRLRNWYADPVVADAQALLAAEAAAALAGHEALWAWDLGNENSNCVLPPDRAAAGAWLARIASEIRAADDTALVTVGLHMEDLEEDRMIGPHEVSVVCDFLSMHGYPIYTRWADGPTDDQLLAFLACMTRWLGDEREILFSEFGLPTHRHGERPGGEGCQFPEGRALRETERTTVSRASNPPLRESSGSSGNRRHVRHRRSHGACRMTASRAARRAAFGIPRAEARNPGRHRTRSFQ